MSTTCDPTELMSSGEMRTIDPRRLTEIEQRHALVTEFLGTHGYDALLLRHPDLFAWFTCGGDSSRGGTPETTASLFITPTARVILSNNVDSGQVFDWEVSGLGFQLKERPWQEPREVLIEDLCRGRNVAADTPTTGTTLVADELIGLRLPLSGFECGRLRELSRRVAHAVEATARNIAHRVTEAEVAGELAHRLLRHQVQPVRLQVWADSQGHRYRHWGFGPDPIERYCVITAIGRSHGLHAAASRTVCFDEPTEQVRAAHERALLIQATGIHFSRPGSDLGQVWQRVQRIYEKFGHAEEWRHADQAELIGYRACEEMLVPGSEFVLDAGMPVCWHPSVGPALVNDTILVADEGVEVLTRPDNWPVVTVEVKGEPIPRPGLLVRAV